MMSSFLKKLFLSVVSIGSWALFFIKTLIVTLKNPPSWRLIINQVYEIGVLSVPVVTITGFSTGLVLAAQSFYQLSDKGLASTTGLFVGKGMLTEIGPILTAFMVTGRVASAMTAVIGTMKVTEQIDALKSMSINPLAYLVSPRLIATCATLPALTLFSAVMGILGGYLISVFVFHMTPQGYLDPIPIHTTPLDIWTGAIKAFFFALLISTIACYKGMTTYGGAQGVGRSTTSCVVTCYCFILIVNFLLTMILNILYNYLKYRTS